MTTITQGRIEPAPPPRRTVGSNLNAVAAIAFRDFLKLVRDPGRILATFLFPLIFIGFLGSGMQASFGDAMGYNYLTFVFTGVLAQTLWQSTTSGIISLLDDRVNDFSQAIFVSPVSRYSIVFGKILGETLVALPQGAGILVFGFILGVPMDAPQVVGLMIAGVIGAIYGGAFGLLLLGVMPSRRAADQLFPFVFLPQFFTAGIFVPINNLPLPLEIISLLSPLRYVVDLTRGLYYWGTPEFQTIVLDPILFNLTVLGASFVAFMVIGTALFVRAERNR